MFGVGIGAFWFMLAALRSADVALIAATTRNAVRAEWFIAAPVAVVQPTTGYLLMLQLDYSLHSRWFLAVASFYILAGMCWVYLVKAELKYGPRCRAIARHPCHCPTISRVPPLERLALGSFAGVLTIFWLMVFRRAVSFGAPLFTVRARQCQVIGSSNQVLPTDWQVVDVSVQFHSPLRPPYI
jgi:uncharacterized membrane protein